MIGGRIVFIGRRLGSYLTLVRLLRVWRLVLDGGWEVKGGRGRERKKKEKGQ